MKTRILISAFILILIGFACKPKATKVEGQPLPAAASMSDSMKMIAAKIYIKAGREEEFIEAAKWIIENTLKEEGCLEYTLYQDPYKKTNFLMFERYKSRSAINAHFAAPYFKEFGGKVGDMTSQATEIKIYSISEDK
jgi:quinol monooxygenase YgiN